MNRRRPWLAEREPGIYFFPAGPAWNAAYAGAADYLRECLAADFGASRAHKLLLGPKLPRAGYHHVLHAALGQDGIAFGKRIAPWQDWVVENARANAIARGDPFQEFALPARREFLRDLLAALEAKNLLGGLSGLWHEEALFADLLDALEELRLAGFSDPVAIAYLEEALASRGHEFAGATKADLWKVVSAWNHAIQSAIEGFHDFPRALQALAASRGGPASPESSLYLLGFERLHLLEQEAIRAVARAASVFFPVALSAAELAAAMAGRNPEGEATPSGAWATVRLLAGHSDVGLYALETGADSESASETVAAGAARVLPLLRAATPLEECRAAGAYLRTLLAEKKIASAQVVVPLGYLDDENRSRAFREALGVDTLTGLRGPRSAYSRVFLQLCQTVEIVAEDYPLVNCLEFADLLSVLKGKRAWRTVPELALRHGVDDGLPAWEELAQASRDPEVREFTEELAKLRRRFPLRATARDYQRRLEEFVADIGYAETAVAAPDGASERVAHAAIALALKAASLLATHTESEFALKDWLKEWRLTVGMHDVIDENSWTPAISVFRIGDWLPPLAGNGLRLCLGMTTDANPAGLHGFLLRERDRAALADWGVASTAGEEADCLAWYARMRAGNRVLLSRPIRGEGGEELANGLVVLMQPTQEFEWPAADALFRERDGRALGGVREFQLPAENREKFSPTLIDDWYDCGFRALVTKVWRITDSLRVGELDPSAKDDGTLIHRALEIFYTKERGRALPHAEARREAIRRAFAQAEAETPLEYFRGGRYLREVSRAQVERRLERFVEAEAREFQAFPDWQVTDCEHKFEWRLPNGKLLRGTIDRIDRDAARGRYLVVDYKTGASPPETKEVRSLAKLQLPLYLKALSAEAAGDPVGAFYIKTQPYERAGGLVRKRFNQSAKNKGEAYFRLGPTNRALLEDGEFFALIEGAVAEAERRADAMDGGAFPVRPADPDICKRCAVRPACRIRDDFVHRPSAPKPTARDFLALDEKLRALAEIPASPSHALEFSADQERALSASGKMIFLEASAGSGKTTILVEKYVRALGEIAAARKIGERAAAERILAVSFTEKSAEEVRDRLTARLAETLGSGVAVQAARGVSTIHGFCRRVLSDFADLAGIDPYGDVLDAGGANALFFEVAGRFFKHPPPEASADFAFLYAHYRRRDLEAMLSALLARRSLLEFDREQLGAEFVGKAAEGVRADCVAALLRLFASFTRAYDGRKRELAVLDFNDLERLAWRVLQHELARNHYRQVFDLVLVDEFQDTNSIQREILGCVASPGFTNAFFVGDAKQSIYRFRAADVSVFQKLRREAAERGIVCALDANYRSQATIVDFANRLSRAIFPAAPETGKEFEATYAEAEATRPPGAAVKFLTYNLPEDGEKGRGARREFESRALVDLLARLRAAGKSLSEVALLFRGLAGNEIYLEALQAAGIPFSLANRGRFWSNQAILDGVAFLRSLVDRSNILSRLALLRSPWFALPPAELGALARDGALGITTFFTNDTRAAWWREMWTELTLTPLAELLARAYARYPGFGNRFERLQMEKLVARVAELEKKQASKFAVVEALSAQSGWEAEGEAEREAAVPEPALGGAVQVLTVHAAKGLQFDTVVLCDVDGTTPPDYPALRFEAGTGLAIKVRNEAGEWEKGEDYDELTRRNAERELAEMKRLLYVAVTRPKHELYILLDAGTERRRGGPTWGDWLRATDFGNAVVREELDATKPAPAGPPATARAPDRSREGILLPSAPVPARRITSVSELSAFVFCSEFHRLKYVRRWEDSVVDLWATTPLPRRKQAADEARALLHALGLTKKDRGIALHRVFERIDGTQQGEDAWRSWLIDSYRNQGVDTAKPELAALLRADVELVGRFLESKVGRELFAPEAEAYAELPFLWERAGHVLSGAVDRIVRTVKGEWIVADYKTASLSESSERYTFQVQGYMAALARALTERGEVAEGARVTGWLIDLFSGEAIRVARPDPARWARSELEAIERGHAAWRERLPPEARGVTGTEACTVCGYASHCTMGRQYVLNFSQKNRLQ